MTLLLLSCLASVGSIRTVLVKSILFDGNELQKGLRDYQESKKAEIAPLADELRRTEKIRADKQLQLEKLLDDHLEGTFPKEIIQTRAQLLRDDIRDAEQRKKEIEETLNSATLTPERIKDIKEFARQLREDLALIEDQPGLHRKKKILNLLEVKVTLAKEGNCRVAYAACVIGNDTLDFSSLTSCS